MAAVDNCAEGGGAQEADVVLLAELDEAEEVEDVELDDDVEDELPAESPADLPADVPVDLAESVVLDSLLLDESADAVSDALDPERLSVR